MKIKEILISQQEKDLLRNFFRTMSESDLSEDKIIGCLVSATVTLINEKPLVEKAFYIEKVEKFMKEILLSNQDNYKK